MANAIFSPASREAELNRNILRSPIRRPGYPRHGGTDVTRSVARTIRYCHPYAGVSRPS